MTRATPASRFQGGRSAALEGVDCGRCLDFGDLPGLGPCPACRPEEFTEHILTLETANPGTPADAAKPPATSTNRDHACRQTQRTPSSSTDPAPEPQLS